MLMPGHLLLYHPGVVKLKELVDSGELGEVLYVYGNRQNLGTIRPDENALWSLGAHDLSIILYLLGEEPSELWARGESFLKPGVEDVVFCYLRFPSGKTAHMHLSWLDPHKIRRMTVVGKERMAVFDDMELDRKVTVYDSAAEPPLGTYGEWSTRVGRRAQPAGRQRRAAAPRVLALPRARPRRGRPAGAGPGRARRRPQPRAAPGLARARARLTARIAETAVVYPGTVLGEDVVIGDHAVVGKAPTLGAPLHRQRRAAAPARRRRRDRDPRRRRRLRRDPDGERGHRRATRRASASAASSATTSSSAAARSSRTTRSSARARGSRRTPTSPPTRRSRRTSSSRPASSRPTTT